MLVHDRPERHGRGGRRSWPGKRSRPEHTSGAGGTEPRDECGRRVLSCRRQPSMRILASWSVEKISPLSSSSRSSPRSRRSSGSPPPPSGPALSAPQPAAAWRRSPQAVGRFLDIDPSSTWPKAIPQGGPLLRGQTTTVSIRASSATFLVLFREARSQLHQRRQ